MPFCSGTSCMWLWFTYVQSCNFSKSLNRGRVSAIDKIIFRGMRQQFAQNVVKTIMEKTMAVAAPRDEFIREMK